MGSALNYPSPSVFLPYKGLKLYVTVAEYNELMYTPNQRRLKKLSDTRQMSPYVCLEYADSKLRTNNCTDGNNKHVFNDEFEIQLVEGHWEINVSVWNRNTISGDDLIGRGWISLEEILSQDYDDSFWALQCESGRYAGEVQLIMEVSRNRAISLRVPPMTVAGASSKLFKPVYREALIPAAPSPTSTMFIPIKGLPLQVTVVGCCKLRNTKQMSPYVCIEYANSVFRTKNCPDSPINLVFIDETVIQLVEGVVEMVVSVRSSNTEGEKLIGIGRILLEEVLSQGYDDSLWALHCRNGRFAGVIQLIMQLSPENAEVSNEPFEQFEVEFRKSITPAAVPYHTLASPSIPSAPPYAPDYPQKHGSLDNEEMEERRLSNISPENAHSLGVLEMLNAEASNELFEQFEVEFRKSITPAAVPYHTPASPSIPSAPPYAPDYPRKHGSFDNEEMEERRLSNCEEMEEHRLSDFEVVWEHPLSNCEEMEEHKLFDYDVVWERC